MDYDRQQLAGYATIQNRYANWRKGAFAEYKEVDL